MNTFVSIIASQFKLTEEMSALVSRCVQRLFDHDACPIRLNLELSVIGPASAVSYHAQLHVQLRAADFYVSMESNDLLKAVQSAVERAEYILAEFIEHSAAPHH